MASNSRKLSAGSIIGLSALFLSVTAVVLLLVTFVFGSVHGTEFNPQTFERRMFGFHEIPLVRLQVTPLWRVEANGEVEELVIAQPYVKPEPNAPEQWHLISLTRRNYKQPPTDVQILARYLDASDEDGDSYWTEWSIKHADMAAIFWPEVARLARLEQYVLLPKLFDLARNAEELKTFQADLKQLQTKQLKEMADRLQQRTAKVEDEKVKEDLKQRAEALAAAVKSAEEELSKEPKLEEEKPKPAAKS
jgi:hypothetical protein